MNTEIQKIYEDYGVLHQEECYLHSEELYEAGCTCGIKEMVDEIVLARDKHWVKMCKEHRKICNPEGKKDVTKILERYKSLTKDTE